jgi:WD40 repeat protein
MDTVTSIALSKDGRYLLANVSFKSPRLELYDLGPPTSNQRTPITKKATLIRRFKGGHTQETFVLRCAFGGSNESFVLCGSEDSSISIWNRNKGELVAHLKNGHAQSVGCVAWCPSEPFVFASASDDQTVRLWGIESCLPCEISQEAKDIKVVNTMRHHLSVNSGKYSP